MPINYEYVKFFFDSNALYFSAVDFPDRQIPAIHHRLYLDIKISVAYNFQMAALIELTKRPAIGRGNGMRRIARLLFHPFFWSLGSLLSTSNMDIKAVTPTVPVSLR
jgi:hypothetical protein